MQAEKEWERWRYQRSKLTGYLAVVAFKWDGEQIDRWQRVSLDHPAVVEHPDKFKLERDVRPLLKAETIDGERKFQRECDRGTNPPWHAFWPTNLRQRVCTECRKAGRR